MKNISSNSEKTMTQGRFKDKITKKIVNKTQAASNYGF